jgi:pyridoxal phosphate enzyme (YggS family)
MHDVVQNLLLIENLLKAKTKNKKLPKIIAVSKTFSISAVYPLIDHGHVHFGENKVQESLEKWTDVKKKFVQVKLHMIGKLQTNKVKYVLPLFDYIHSLDSLKLAKKISEEQEKQKKKLKIFIQLNIGNEEQKSGIEIKYLEEFYKICINDLNLDIIGLMCLPPKNLEASIYFSKMQNTLKKTDLAEISMGMSSDFLSAINYGATFLRIGSKIFGNRD